jgi:fructokinase
MAKVFGGIEAGGTKFVCGIGTGPQDYKNELIIPTSSPSKTLDSVIDYFTKLSSKYSISGIGIGSFGPLDLNIKSKTYGSITTTPKKQWVNTDILGIIKRTLGIPVFIDTDVNAAALGEWKWGAAKGLNTFIYLTIGTGIGGGGIVNGKLMHGLVHPEMGHIFIPHDSEKDTLSGICPAHNDCFEGLASGPAIESRWKINPKDLPSDHKAWDLEAMYIAYALVNYICTLSPQRIIIGGGVMQQGHLFPTIRHYVKNLINNYIKSEDINNKIDNFIVPPKLGAKSGVLGAIALAQNENSIQCS